MRKYNAEIQQNASWILNIQVTDSGGTPMNLTNYTGKSQIKPAYGSSIVLASPTVTITVPLEGRIKIELTATQTALLEPTPTTCKANELPVWDVLISNQDNTYTPRILEGTVTITPGVTVWS